MAWLIVLIVIVYLIVSICNFLFLGPVISTATEIAVPYLDQPLPDTNIWFKICSWYPGIDPWQKLPVYTVNSKGTIQTSTTFNWFDAVDDTVILYFHSFFSDAQEIAGYEEKIAKDLGLTQNWTFYAPNLPGVSYRRNGFANITAQDYMHFYWHIITAALGVTKNVYLVASSTGCSYIIWYIYFLGIKGHPMDTLNIHFMSPNIEFHTFEKYISKLALYPFGKKMINLLNERVYTKDETKYFDTNEFVHLVGIMGILRKIYDKLTLYPASLTITYTVNDKVVSPKAIEDFYEKYKGNKSINRLTCEEHFLPPVIYK